MSGGTTTGMNSGARETQLSSQLRRWEADLDLLLELLRRIERDNTAVAAALLATSHRLREMVEDLPDRELQSLARRFLDQVWEVARAAIYGDLELVRERTALACELAGCLGEALSGPWGGGDQQG